MPNGEKRNQMMSRRNNEIVKTLADSGESKR